MLHGTNFVVFDHDEPCCLMGILLSAAAKAGAEELKASFLGRALRCREQRRPTQTNRLTHKEEYPWQHFRSIR